MTITPCKTIQGYIAEQRYPLASYTTYGRTRAEALANIIKAITRN